MKTANEAIWQKNIKRLKEYNEFLYEDLEIDKVSFSDEKEVTFQNNENAVKVDLVETKDGMVTYHVTYEGREARLNSLYNQEREAERWAGQYKVTNAHQVIVCFGLGNGVCIKELMKHILDDTVLIIIEPEKELFLRLLNDFDYEKVWNHKLLQLLVGQDCEDAFEQVLSLTVDWTNVDTLRFIHHPQYDLLFPATYKKLYQLYMDYRNLVVANHMTERAIGKTMCNNILTNLEFSHRESVITEVLQEFDIDIPAIIVSAGPSLDKNITELKNLKNNAYIIAVDTAVKYLLAHDINPDMIVTLDPEKNMWHLVDPRCHSVPLFCRIESNPLIIQNFERVVFFNLDGYFKTVVERIGKVADKCNSGGSVTTGAFSACLTIGFRTIILVGSDLAYLGGKTHAGNLTVDVSNTGRYLVDVEDIYGNIIKTRYDWYVYLKWLEDAVKRSNGIRVIDATEGGAKIHGTELLTLKETIEEINNQITKEKNQLQCKGSLAPDVWTVLEEDVLAVENIIIRIQENKKYAKEILQTIGKGKSPRQSLINKLAENNNWIESQFIYRLIDQDITNEASDDVIGLANDNDTSFAAEKRTFERALNLYETILASAENIREKLKNLLEGR